MPERRSWIAVVALLLVLGVLLSALAAMRQPLANGDYMAIWGLKARAIFRSGNLSSVFRVDPAGDASHPEYPPLWPLVLAGTSALVGEFDEMFLTVLWPVLCLGSALLAVRATRGPWPFRLLAGAGVSLLPYYRNVWYVGYAEALLVFFIMAALSEVEGLARGGLPLHRFALFLTLAAATKQEGTLAAVVAVVILAAARRSGAALLTGASVILLAVLPWSLFLFVSDPDSPRRDFSPAAFNPGHLLPAARVVAEEAVLPHAGWILGALLLLGLAPGTRMRRRVLLSGAGLYICALFTSFAFTTRDPAWHVFWSWDRLLLVPIAALMPVLSEAAAEAIGAHP